MYALDSKERNHFQLGAGAGLSFTKKAAFKLGLERLNRILIGEVGREAVPCWRRRLSRKGNAWDINAQKTLVQINWPIEKMCKGEVE